ncbi:expressed unknown protein [Seminavis robusta]|uniref:Uncharacterized protein n=1 Tax=Seminavis robusta TaxID=568900 RepID=A0A9N8HYW0_9STRA|nr:expressed unknown protein [Seminavis robusta]|eukprot:Sro3085_g343400.1 n/a (91) ;mRNA; f:3530-3802
MDQSPNTNATNGNETDNARTAASARQAADSQVTILSAVKIAYTMQHANRPADAPNRNRPIAANNDGAERMARLHDIISMAIDIVEDDFDS